MNQISVLPFGQIAEITGAEAFQLVAADTDEIQRVLADRFPELHRKHYAIAVDKVIVKSNTPINSNSVIALLPPFSGG
jgi:molybdopterin synthase sulfur carrier subunit